MTIVDSICRGVNLSRLQSNYDLKNKSENSQYKRMDSASDKMWKYVNSELKKPDLSPYVKADLLRTQLLNVQLDLARKK